MVGRRMILAASLSLCGTLFLRGEVIPNWPAPATWSPSRSAGTLTTQDVTNPLPFVGLAPCRLVDTRGNGFTGAYGPPSLAAGVRRDFPLSGQCGIPSGAGAVSLNVTVTNTQGPGFIKIYPQGGSAPVVSTLNYVAGQTIANAAVVPLGAGGGVTMVAGVSGTDLVVDTNGYCASAAANQGNTFTVINSGGTTVPAILGQTNSASLNATGVKGVATVGVTNGVWGDNLSTSDGATGVFGFAEGTAGVTTGVWGRSVSSSFESRGVYGEGLTTMGRVYGVYGYSASPQPDSAGVRGLNDSGPIPGDIGFDPAGVRGEGVNGFGVLGVSQMTGVAGYQLNGFGVTVSAGYLGDAFYGVGVYFKGGLAGTGTKSFVEPHPTDPTKLIKYVSLEGPEAGVYFRGRGRARRGAASIDLPESFRMVAAEEGLSIQVTPIGEFANIAVAHIGLDGIAIKASRDVEFFYTVSGVRRAYPVWNPIQENGREFVPEGPDAKLPAYLSPNESQRLIDNGTYNADGTVNLQTAERVGWTRMWAEREEQARAAAARSAAGRLRD
ncbi:MAG TPA: hypothetical protein VKJ00_15260 [Thermoanaerobaculia bacterium]|nr:hypothetical protein [Thermoanaerobaculia bacterium]